MLKDQIIGTWILESWTYQDETGVTVDYLGYDPLGQLHYSPDNLMSVQIMKNGRQKFTGGHLTDGTEEEVAEAFKSFFAYFGTYEEKEPGVLVHHILGSNFPNWTGEKEIRYAKMVEGDLILSAPSTLPDNQEVMFEVKWKRPE